MATIRTALAMYDGMTAPLMQMNQALHIVLNSFEAVQTASGNAIDVSAIQEAREALARAETAFDSIEQEIRQWEQSYIQCFMVKQWEYYLMNIRILCSTVWEYFCCSRKEQEIFNGLKSIQNKLCQFQSLHLGYI